jgi:hypothetical protein
MTSCIAILLGLCVAIPARAWGQVVRGDAREAESGRGIESGVVTLVNADGAGVRVVLTDSVGAFGLRAPVAGVYRLRFERLGFRPVITDRFTLDAGETETRTIRATPVSISLERIIVTDRPRCRILAEADTLTARVWSAVRSVLAVAAASEVGLNSYVTIERYERDYDHRRNIVTNERKWTTTGASTAPFVAIAARELEKHGFVVRQGDSVAYYAPETRTLIADEFLRTHCFRVRDDRAERGRVGLDIEPVPGRFLPDIKGTLWLDARSGELRRLEFVYVHLPPDAPLGDADGWVEFRRLPRGAWIVDRWALRLPLVGPPPAQGGYGARLPGAGGALSDRTPDLLGIHEEGGRVLSLESHRPRSSNASTATVSVRGSVRTVGGDPVPGARAFLSGTSYSSVPDAEGNFAILDVPQARYRLSFTHPRFDTLGVVGQVIEVDANGTGEHQLMMPTDEEIARSVCVRQGAQRSNAPVALLYGYVRDGSSAAGVPAATVTVSWRAAIARGPRVGVRTQAVEVQSDTSGFYQVCGVPREIQLTARATKGTRRGVEERIEPLRPPVNRVDVTLPSGRPPRR